MLWRPGIRSLNDFGNPVGPLGQSVLYLRDGTHEAAPKCISGRTSYLQVRLAFHRYPQLIRAVFNRHRFGPPAGDYPAFNLAMGRSPGFGSTLTDTPPRLNGGNALFGLGFPAAPPLQRRVNLPANVTRRFILQKARRRTGPAHGASTAWGRRVSGSVSLRSRGSFHLSLTVLVRYRWPGVVSLGGWSPQIPPGFLVSRGTWVATPSRPTVPYRPVTVSRAAFQQTSGSRAVSYSVG
jgi:hypothetical protein